MSKVTVLKTKSAFYAVVLVVLLCMPFAVADPAHAATIVVDADCTLADAIIAANTDASAGDCRAGSAGSDTIVLQQDVILTAAHTTSPDGPTGLPSVTSDITILGNGFTIARSDAAGTPNFRLFHVEAEASLRLVDVTLRNGRVSGATGRAGGNATRNGGDGEDGERGSVGFVISGAGHPGDPGDPGNPGGQGVAGGAAYGGAILNRGTLELERCTVADNVAQGGVGGAGGNGSRGGEGGEGGPPGIPIPLVIIAMLGPPGAGGAGGTGGTGGDGGAGGGGQGGAIYNDGGALVIRSCVLHDNQAVGGRGGVGGQGGSAGEGGSGGIGQDTVGPGGSGGSGGFGGIGGAGGPGQGGAIYNASGTVSVSLSTIQDSRAQGGAGNRGGLGRRGADGALSSGDGGLGGGGGTGGLGGTGQGGAIYSAAGEVVIGRSILAGNDGRGGAAGQGNNAGDSGDGGSPFLRLAGGAEGLLDNFRDLMLDSVLSGTRIGGVGGPGGAGGSGQGGAVFAGGGLVTIRQSTLVASRTEAAQGGSGGQGGLGGFPNDLLRQFELLGAGPGGSGRAGEAGSSQGGGLYADNAQLEVFRSTLTGNQSAAGGAVWYGVAGAESRIVSSTVAGNAASRRGGGLDLIAPLSLANSIIADNTAPDGPDIRGTINSLDYNLIGTSNGATLNGPINRTLVDVSPGLDALEDNGGSTPTVALLADSPAINRGQCSNTTDQRGYYRVDDRCDIGAYERGASLQPPRQLPPPVAGAASDSLRFALPAGIYASVIASDGVFLRHPAEIGVQAIIDLGVVHAIDVFSLSGSSAVNTPLCLRGSGDVFLLAASGSPRVPYRLAATRQGDFSCVWIGEPGTVVQVRP